MPWSQDLKTKDSDREGRHKRFYSDEEEERDSRTENTYPNHVDTWDYMCVWPLVVRRNTPNKLRYVAKGLIQHSKGKKIPLHNKSPSFRRVIFSFVNLFLPKKELSKRGGFCVWKDPSLPSIGTTSAPEQKCDRVWSKCFRHSYCRNTKPVSLDIWCFSGSLTKRKRKGSFSFSSPKRKNL